MENDYHNPYDHRRHNGGDDTDQLNHYEAPSCLVRNPSGSLFIPPSGIVKVNYHVTLDFKKLVSKTS